MSDSRWTDKQLEAITARDKEILVSAAAGSGKTAVLVERIIRRIATDKDTIDIDRMLVVTFTKAAAAEMSQRVGLSLAKKVSENAEEIRQNPDNIKLKESNINLQNQLTLLNRADIKTIHSFCLQVIREYYHVLDIDPSVKTADEIEISMLQQEVMEEYFEELYEKGDVAFLDLLESYSEETKDNRLKEIILKLSSFANGFPDSFGALDSIYDNYNVTNNNGVFNVNNFEWTKTVQKTLSKMIERAVECADASASTITENTYKAGVGAVDTINSEYNAIVELYNSVSKKIDYNDWYEKLSKIKFETLRGGSDLYEAERVELKKYRDITKDIIKQIKKKYLMYSYDTQNKITEKLCTLIKNLVTVTKDYMMKFAKAKKQRMLIDFTDYEHFALEILVEKNSTLDNIIPTIYAKEMQKRYDEIMIDEYQDSNIVQEMLLSAVSNGKNRFIVGDVKQSIYAFRLAMPELFAGKLNNAGVNEHKILMTNNFRSRENVLYGINFLFAQFMDVEFGDVDYNSDVALHTPADPKVIYPDAPDDINVDFQNEVIVIESVSEKNKSKSDNKKEDANEDDNDENLEEDLDKYELEISAIVTKINQMLEDKTHIYDAKIGKYRLLEYSDCAIICRSIKNIRGAVETIFTRENIPYYIESSLSYFDVLEVDTILNLLRIIDNPIQDIPLIALLRSPIYKFSADELVQIRINSKNSNFYTALINYMPKDEDENEDEDDNRYSELDFSDDIYNKIQKFFGDIEMYREKSKEISLFELISFIYDYTGYFNYVGVGEGGCLRQSNLRLLLQKAYVYEMGSYQGLFYFIRFIEDLKLSSDDESSAKDDASIGKALQITTIHKSKGLEYPVVFVALAGKGINLMDTNNKIVLHREYGISTKYTDLESRGIYKSLFYQLISDNMKYDTYSEEVRVLYVALTRAREKLIIVGCVKDLEKSIEKWGTMAEFGKKRFDIYDLRKTKTYLDLIMPALMRHYDVNNFGGKLPDEFINYGNKDVFKQGIPDWQKCTWDVSAYKKDEVFKPFEEKKQILLGKQMDFEKWENTIIDGDNLDDVKNIFGWEYQFGNSTKIQGKTTISEMKRKFLEEDDNSTKDYYEDSPFEFLEENADSKKKKINSAMAGTILHKVMEMADFKRGYSEDELFDFIAQLVQNNIISDDEAQSIKLKELSGFFKSDIYKRMQNADVIEKEHVFSMLLSPKEAFVIDKDDDSDYGDDKILVNGMIDCYFIENNKITLLDYKSDRLNTKDEFVNRYEIQLKMYKQALEKALDEKVDEVVIYSFNMNKEIMVDCD